MKLKWILVEQVSCSVNILLEFEMVMLCIDGGCKVKICSGDILGVLIGEVGLIVVDVGKIDMFFVYVYVVICKVSVKCVLQQLQ